MQNHKPQLQPPVTTYHPNGNKKSEKNYKNNKPHGLYTEWYENGNKKSKKNYKDGTKHGLETNWSADDQNATEITWIDGLKRKECKRKGSKKELVTKWYKNGQKRMEGTLSNDKRHGLETHWWDENGWKKWERTWKDGKKHGPGTYWYESIITLSPYKYKEENYKNDKKHGVFTWWHENGQKKHEMNYKDGELHGMNSWWYENGQKESVEYFVLAKSYARINWNKEGNVTKAKLPTLPPPPAKPSKKTQLFYK